MNTEYIVRRGQIHVYRLFDVAYSIDLDSATRFVQSGQARRMDLHRSGKGQISMPAPPLSFSLSQQRVNIDGYDYAVDGQARVFDFGVISLLLKVAIPRDTTLNKLVALNALICDHPNVERLARDLLHELFDQLKGAMVRPQVSGFVEDYTVIYVDEFNAAPQPDTLAADPVMPLLLLGETSPRGISQHAAEDAVHKTFAYYADELAIIDWNSAFIYDPGGDPDIGDLIEFASAQLLELRYYDDLLDRELNLMYDEVERVRGLNRRAQYRALTRRLLQVVLEVTELTEKIDNSLKWVGDLYLARFYQAAADQFNLARWQAQVERKLTLMTRSTELLNDQITTDRTLWLETGVVVLILMELVLAFLRY